MLRKYLFIFIILYVSFTGCVSFSDLKTPGKDSGKIKNYFRDRVMDARDIFTLTGTFGVVGGVKGQIGPLGTGLYVESGAGYHTNFADETGLRNGETGMHATDDIVLLFGSDSSFPESYGGNKERAELRGKNYESAFSHPAAYTRLGFAIALLGGVRFEFNIGELADFLLGFFLIDIYGDDVYLKAPVRTE